VESMWKHGTTHNLGVAWVDPRASCDEDDELGVTVMMWTPCSCVVPATNRLHIFGVENMVVTCKESMSTFEKDLGALFWSIDTARGSPRLCCNSVSVSVSVCVHAPPRLFTRVRARVLYS
jgi:hypothetical protein